MIAQTYRPIECIVVDDGSTDNTKEVVNEQIKQNSDLLTVKYIYQENSGSQVARNTGTNAATGDFIQYLDSDDLLYPDKIQSQVNYLQSNPDCDAIFGDWEKGALEKKVKVVGCRNKDLLSQMLTEQPLHTLAPLMRKSLVEEIGEWDVNVKRNQEIDFHLRGLLAGGKFEYQPLLCGLWRLHSGERIGNATKFSDAIYFYKKWETILRGQKLWNESFSSGFVKNYQWFLGNYPDSNNAETVHLLQEMYRLQPRHSIFTNKKFKLLKTLFGVKRASLFWVMNYKRNLRKKNG